MKVVRETHLPPCQWLEQVTGTRWVGVEFLKHLPADWGCLHREPVRFCEAVCKTRKGHTDLLPETIRCEGAKRAFRWTRGEEEGLVLHLCEKTGMNAARARELVGQVPVLADSYAGIRIGDCADPGVLVTYVRPEAAMRLIRLWETAMGHSLHAEISSIMAVCGNAVVKAHVSHAISVSFGCPDSRQYGGIQPEELVVAVSTGLFDRFRGIADTGLTLSAK
jgi:uncharacterized protein (DUF169 family)